MWHLLPYVAEINSTNDFFKTQANNYAHQSILRAGFQTHGRGQFDRHWEANKGENLLFSILLKDFSLDKIESIREWIITSLLKWLLTFSLKGEFKAPNDIYVEKKKILGILIETKQSGIKFLYVVIGIGINVNQMFFQSPLATSIKLLTNKNHDLEFIFPKLLKILKDEYPL